MVQLFHGVVVVLLSSSLLLVAVVVFCAERFVSIVRFKNGMKVQVATQFLSFFLSLLLFFLYVCVWPIRKIFNLKLGYW